MAEARTEEELLGVRLEVLIAVGLGLAAILTAISIYLTDVHDDNALVAFNDGVAEVTEATGGYVEGSQLRSADAALFTEYAQLAYAGSNGDQQAFDTAAYIQTSIMRPELRQQVDWWASKGEAQGFLTPFVDENPYYTEPALEEANATTASATANFEEAKDEQKIGDRFILADVIVATALFLFGIAAVASLPKLKVAMTSIAYVVFLIALGVVVTGL